MGAPNMPNWTTNPPAPNKPATMPLVRPKSGRPQRGTIISTEPLYCETHFWHRRTVPCEAPNCQACSEGYPPRWHCYIVVMGVDSGRLCILELTHRAAEPLRAWHEKFGTIRGVLLDTFRPGSRPNAPVQITLTATTETAGLLPNPPNIRNTLTLIWATPMDEANTPDAVVQQITAPRTHARARHPLPDPRANHRPLPRQPRPAAAAATTPTQPPTS